MTLFPSPSGTEFETLCDQVPLGHRRRLYLSLNVALVARHTRDWGGRVWTSLAGQRVAFRGPFRELAVETVVTCDRAEGNAVRYLRGFPFLRINRKDWVSAPGVELADLSRLAELTQVYRANLITVQAGHSVVNEIRILPTEVETELRRIASRLNALSF